jgi:sulfite dehydrogenase
MDAPHSRRRFLERSTLAAVAASLPLRGGAQEKVTMPFANGERPLVRYPQKRPLIELTHRPPQLETPFSVFNEGVITPNDAFFVRYHLPGLPLSIDAEAFRLEVKGHVERPQSLSLKQLRTLKRVTVAAVNQCSGNSRGFSEPRVGGGQWGHGAMGNAWWSGVRLKEVLELAGVKAKARQVLFNGLDTAPLPATPDYVKTLEIDHALDGEVLLAFEMNEQPLPMLNGFPLRLVVPGYYGTYWVKHLSEITVLPDVYDGFWMNPAYRIPETPDGFIEPGTTPKSTVPIGRLNVRSFITSHTEGARVKPGNIAVKGIAFDGGRGIREVSVSDDEGQTWKPAKLGAALGTYSFVDWTFDYQPKLGSGENEKTLLSRATSNSGETQPMKAGWNPPGYLRNVVERVKLAFVALAVLFAAAASTSAGEVTIVLPPEKVDFKAASGVDLAQSNCLLCHSSDYLPTQPPMSRKFWEATVKKMREKYGAPVAEENVPKLVEYLVAAYGTEGK